MNSVFTKTLSELAHIQPHEIIVTDAKRRTLDRRALTVRIQCIASGLYASGLRPGDRVLFAVRPSVSFVALALGIYDAGGVIVPIDADTGDELFHARMGQLQPRWLVADAVLLAAAKSTLTRTWLRAKGIYIPPLLDVPGVNVIRVGSLYPGTGNALSLKALERRGRNTVVDTPEDPDSDAFIVFTSGTTGRPKAVVHSRRSLESIISLVSSQLNPRETDTFYVKDLHLMLPALMAGSKVIIPSQSTQAPSKVLHHLNKHRVTHTFLVPSECQKLIDYISDHSKTLPPTLRMVLLGAAPVSRSILNRLNAIMAPETTAWCIYGMTEILPVAMATLDEKLSYAGTGDFLGKLVPGVHARINPTGELVLNGPNLFVRYLGEEPISEHSTGDLGRLEGDKIILLGRLQDMIIRGQKNIYPALYEPTVEDIDGVLQCAMVGVYDDTLADERVVLFVEPEAGVDPDFLVARLLRELRNGPNRIDMLAQPDAIKCITLPNSGRSNKIDRLQLRILATTLLSCA